MGRRRSKGKESKMTIILYLLSKVKDLNFLLKCYRGLSGQESTCQCRPGFNPWVGKIPWRRKWQPSPVFLRIPWTEEPGGLKSMGSQESVTTEHRHTHTHTQTHTRTFNPPLMDTKLQPFLIPPIWTFYQRAIHSFCCELIQPLITQAGFSSLQPLLANFRGRLLSIVTCLN